MVIHVYTSSDFKAERYDAAVLSTFVDILLAIPVAIEILHQRIIVYARLAIY